MADLKQIGLILTLIGGIIAIVNGVLHFLDSAIDILSFGNFGGEAVGGGVIGAIIAIVLGVICVFFYLGRISVGTDLILGIVVLVIGLFTNLIVIIGGILILIDALT